MSTTNTFPASIDCANEELRFRLFRRCILNFLRGIAAALLMPLEMLECLRCGGGVGPGAMLSWAFSAAMYTGFLEIWNLSNKAIYDGHDRTGSIFGCCFVVLVAGIWSGGMQARRISNVANAFGNSYKKESGLHKHKGMYHESHSGRHHHGDHPHGELHHGEHHHGGHHGLFRHPAFPEIRELQSRSRTERNPETRGSTETNVAQLSAASAQMISVAGICCHNCRVCAEPVCVRTGLAKQGRSL